jgi:hypothetical protein
VRACSRSCSEPMSDWGRLAPSTSSRVLQSSLSSSWRGGARCRPRRPCDRSPTRRRASRHAPHACAFASPSVWHGILDREWQRRDASLSADRVSAVRTAQGHARAAS